MSCINSFQPPTPSPEIFRLYLNLLTMLVYEVMNAVKNKNELILATHSDNLIPLSSHSNVVNL